jgi:organic radical activating enzyme
MPEMLTIYNRNEELHKLSIDEVLKRIELANTEVRAEAVVITGGEPLLHAKPLSNLVPALVEELHLRVEFETNGTIMPLGLTRWSRKDTPRVYFNVSPKLANSVQPAKQRLRWDTLHYFANELSNASIFKFVVDTEEDLEQVEQIVDQLKISRQRVWLMPQATRSEALSIAAREKVIPWCLRHGFRYSHRIHVSIWNDQRGV